MSTPQHYLFSYGTLQDNNVQISTFGRKLTGYPDALQGYLLIDLQITDPHVIEVSGKDVHQILDLTQNQDDAVAGTVFELTDEELNHADRYEVDDYKRILVTLQSGKKAWVYVSVDHP